MRGKKSRGGATIEFAFVLMVLVPLFLGTGVVGINMVRTLQTIQLARDAGHMYARGIVFSTTDTGNVAILLQIGAPLGLSSSATGSQATIILSTVNYIDEPACAALGYVSGSPATPTAACTNYQHWVFSQRLTIGNTTLRSSNFGSPITTGNGSVTVNATTGAISTSDQVTKTGARATFSTINPYQVVNGTVEGLPSGQMIYIAEAAGTGFSMPPFINNPATYAWGLF
jgi:hypothetical protein